jgi:sugar phosphate isomerase/epimerase
MTLKIENKKFNLSYVMGRFSKKIGEKFQHFPIDNWQNEIDIAKKLKFDGVEWIISDYSNPLFNPIYLEQVKRIFKKKKFKICSISLDFIMKEPLHVISNSNLKWIIEKILLIQEKIKIDRISVPIEESSRFNNYSQKKIALHKLKYILEKLKKKSKICIETDIDPKNLNIILNQKNLKKLGLLIDIGNIKANGFDLNDYINYFTDRIYGVHIKYRKVNFGKSEVLPKKFKELEILKNKIDNLNNLKDITFQTYRSKNYFINDMKKSIINFNKIFYE